MRHGDGTVEVFYNDVKMTRWKNGDFKLTEGDKVTFWSE